MPPSRHDDEGIDRLRSAMYSRKFSDGIGPRPRRELPDEEPKVAQDWEQSEEKPRPSILPLELLMRTRPRPQYSILKWILGIAVVFFVGAIGFFVYYLYFGASAVSARNIDIVITGPAEIAGGESADLEVTITNRNNEPLDLADIVATFPSGTRLDPVSCSSTSCTVQLGTIASGATEAIKLPAVYEGQAGQQGVVSLVLEYHIGSSNAIFTANSQYAFTFSSAPVALSVDTNAETISGQPMQITLNVSSNSSQPVSGVLLQATYPFGFKLSSADPQPEGNGLWHLGTLSPGDQRTITINGTLTGEKGDTRVFHFVVGTPSATSTSVDTPLADSEVPISIAQPFLQLGLTVNDASSTRAIAVAPGQLVTVAVTYKNSLPIAIQDAVVVAKLSGIAIDGTTVRADSGFYRSTDDAVLWDKTTTGGELQNLAAGQSGKLTFSFQVPSSDDLKGVQNPTLVIAVNAAGTRVGQTGVPENLQSTVTQKIAVASDLEIASQGLYTSNPFGVTGFMPPQAGSETEYAVVLSITNTTNEIDNSRVTATLPPYVRLVGNHYLPATEKVGFNGTTGVFNWDVGTIAPQTGLASSSPRQVVIEIGFTPSTSQIGTIPVLLQDITLTGTDASTGKTVSKKAPDVTTNIVGDPGFDSIHAKVCSATNCPK